jgi:predicted PurR-regulated permease PerM
MANEEQWQKIVKFTALIISIMAITFILKTLKGIFIPLVVAIFLTYLFAPLVELLAKIKIPRIVSLFIILVIISLLGTLGATILANNIREFIQFWPTLESKLFSDLGIFLKNYLNVDTGNFLDFFRSQRITDIISTFVNRSFSFLGQFLLTLLILIFIYLSYHNYPKLIKKAFKRQKVRNIFVILENINKQIIKYLLIKTLISASTGVLTGVVCAVLGIKFAVLWGVLAFFLNYIPYIGSLVAVIMPLILSFFQFPHSYIPFLAAALLFAIQFFMGSYLDPEMMGNRFNLSPIMIIMSLFFWSYVWGIIGAFLAVPILAVMKIILQNIESFKFMAVLMSKKAEGIEISPKK